jgi:hypothetical protein
MGIDTCLGFSGNFKQWHPDAIMPFSWEARLSILYDLDVAILFFLSRPCLAVQLDVRNPLYLIRIILPEFGQSC